MNYKIQTIPHFAQRYNTSGDYQLKHNQQINISISDMINVVPHELLFGATKKDVALAEKYELLIAVHELIESLLCFQAGIPFQIIDDFDMNFKGIGEPGDDISCPYFQEHAIALKIEKELAAQLGIDWEAYTNAVNKLSEQKEQEIAEAE